VCYWRCDFITRGIIEMSKVTRSRISVLGICCALALLFFAGTAAVFAQGARKDDVVFNAQGRPMAGATVRVCTAAATGQPCAPLALIYSDAALTQALANPISSDGLGNYTFYAAPGRYEIEISGPSITTKQIPNVILPSDPTAPTFATVTTTSGISAFSLTLSGNLTVQGSAAITGALSVGGAPVPSTTADNQWTASQRFKGSDPWRDITAYMPAGGCDQSAFVVPHTTGTITAGTNTLVILADNNFKNGCGIFVASAGALERWSAVRACDSRAGSGAERECDGHGGLDNGALQSGGDRRELRNVSGERADHHDDGAGYAHTAQLRGRVLDVRGERCWLSGI
jgi:hypothetical protein